jgi:hypothetical protein
MQFIFLSSFHCLTKPKHWTRELQRQLAVKRGDRRFANLSHYTVTLSHCHTKRTKNAKNAKIACDK